MKVQYLLNKHELLDHLTNNKRPLEAGNSAQLQRDREAYDLWLKRDRSARYTLLACMHDDLIGEFNHCLTAKEMWDHLRLSVEGPQPQGFVP